MKRFGPYLLLLIGILLSFWVIQSIPSLSRPWYYLVVPIAITAIFAVPALGRLIEPTYERLNNPGMRSRWIIASVLAVVACGYLLFTAHRQGRALVPSWHDECMYIVQAQMMAKFKLWMPPHPVGQFFDSFYILNNPVYASQSFPGCSMLYTPAVWLHLPAWVTPLALAGATVATLYLLMCRLVNGAAGLLSVLMLLAISPFRLMSLKTMGSLPTLLFGMLLMLAWLGWRQQRRWSLALLIGALAGWLAIMRPADAVCLALPVGIAMLMDLCNNKRLAFQTIGLCVLGAAPFLALQLAINVGISGSALKSPFAFYNDRDQPQVILGVKRFDPTIRPQSSLPQKQILYDTWSVPAIKQHQPENFVQHWLTQRIPQTFAAANAQVYLLPLLALGLLGLRDRRRIVVVMVLPLFLLIYALYTIWLPLYALIVVPPMCLLICLGVQQLQALLPDRLRILPPALVAAMAIVALPEFKSDRRDEPVPAPVMQWASTLPEKLPTRAIVLFTFNPRVNNPHEEPVYNLDVAWPDDARVIRAHNLGERNVELFRYYAEHQPDRQVYRFDRGTNKFTELGNVAELARQPAPR